MKFFKKKKSVSNHDSFISLILVACEEEMVRKQIIAIVKQDSFHRQSLLDVMISDLSSKNAPHQLIDALSYLKQDKVAEAAHKLLNQTYPLPSNEP